MRRSPHCHVPTPSSRPASTSGIRRASALGVPARHTACEPRRSASMSSNGDAPRVVDPLEPEAREFYCHTLSVLGAADLEFLIGGAYAFSRYTGIERHTKDFDIFVHPDDFEAVLSALGRAGYRTDSPFPHWLGKAYHGE